MFTGRDPADRQQAAEDARYHAAMCAAMSDALTADAIGMRAPDVDCAVEVVVGPTVPTIVASLEPDDVIVMASHGEGGVRPWLLGGVAKEMLATAPVPVVLVPVEERRRLTQAARVQAPVAQAHVIDHMPVSRLIQAVQSRDRAPIRRTTASVR
jgi:hypothetical protein